jgi:hypothetical protein
MRPTYVLAVDVALAACEEPCCPGAEGAYTAALDTPRWDTMLEVGDARARAGHLPDARRAYLIAFDRACDVDSVEGTLRAAAALARLGEAEAAGQMVRVAERIAARRTPPAPGARGRMEEAA